MHPALQYKYVPMHTLVRTNPLTKYAMLSLLKFKE